MELEAAYADIRASGAQLLAISVDSVDDARAMAEHAGASFPVLSDADRVVSTAYGLFDLLSDGVSAPATLIVDHDGNLAASHVGTSITDRVPAETIVEFLRELSGAGVGTAS
ncbi:MAG: peroxiredoxin family protein [Chloroflexi bacterium]|nr:peroxiredoxin family protein [Chloroflexota bacterium]